MLLETILQAHKELDDNEYLYLRFKNNNFCKIFKSDVLSYSKDLVDDDMCISRKDGDKFYIDALCIEFMKVNTLNNDEVDE
jgi:hypothetical protein